MRRLNILGSSTQASIYYATNYNLHQIPPNKYNHPLRKVS